MLVRADWFRVGSGSTQPRFKVKLMHLLVCDLGSVIFLYLDNPLWELLHVKHFKQDLTHGKH